MSFIRLLFHNISSEDARIVMRQSLGGLALVEAVLSLCR